MNLINCIRHNISIKINHWKIYIWSKLGQNSQRFTILFEINKGVLVSHNSQNGKPLGILNKLKFFNDVI